MTRLRSTAITLAALASLAPPSDTGAARGDSLWTFEDLDLISFCSHLAEDRGSVFAYTQSREGLTELQPFIAHIRSFDAADGSLHWNANEGPDENPVDIVARDGLVFTTSWRATRAGTGIGTVLVHARDQGSGEMVWQQTLGPGRFRYESTAIAADSRTTVIAGARRTAAMPFNIFDFFTAAYDSATGAPLWQDAFDVSGGWDRAEAIAIGQGVVAVGGVITRDFLDFFHIRAYSARDGRLLWQDSVDGGQAWAIAIRGQRLYVTGPAGYNFGDGSHLMAYDLVTGKPIWARAVPGTWMKFAEVLGTRLIVAGSRGGRSEVRAYDRDRGRLLWRKRTPPRRGINGLTAKGNRIYGTGDAYPYTGFIRSWKRGSGRVPWSIDFGGETRRGLGCSVVLADGRLIVSSSEAIPESGDPALSRQVLRAYEP